jgi:hypothetical protein
MDERSQRLDGHLTVCDPVVEMQHQRPLADDWQHCRILDPLRKVLVEPVIEGRVGASESHHLAKTVALPLRDCGQTFPPGPACIE